MSTPKHVLVVAGDPSGDEHAAALVRALKARDSSVRITAAGGIHLQRVADRFLFSLVGVGGFGFLEPLFKLPALASALRQITTVLAQDRPDMVIPVDYYGFNLRVAQTAHKRQIPVVYYISPQVWASRPGRVQTLAKVLTKIMVIFPFEQALYEKANIPVAFTGHPLLDRLPEPSSPVTPVTIGLLPGSRMGIVQRHLPILIETATMLHAYFPEAQFLLFRPPEIPEKVYAPLIRGMTWISLVCEETYEKRKGLSLAISVSGTASLENSLLGIPMIIMYKLSPITYAIAKRLIRVPYVAIPNILAGERIVPEYIQSDATPHKLALAAKELLLNRPLWDSTRHKLLALRKQLGQPGASDRAAEEVLALLKN